MSISNKAGTQSGNMKNTKERNDKMNHFSTATNWVRHEIVYLRLLPAIRPYLHWNSKSDQLAGIYLA